MIMINLDRPREFRFGFKALKMVKALTEKSLITLMKEAQESDNPFMDEEIFEKVVYCGLMSQNKDVTLEKMEDLIDKGDYADIFVKVSQAALEAYGVADDQEQSEEKEEKEDKKK